MFYFAMKELTIMENKRGFDWQKKLTDQNTVQQNISKFL